MVSENRLGHRQAGQVTRKHGRSQKGKACHKEACKAIRSQGAWASHKNTGQVTSRPGRSQTGMAADKTARRSHAGRADHMDTGMRILAQDRREFIKDCKCWRFISPCADTHIVSGIAGCAKRWDNVASASCNNPRGQSAVAPPWVTRRYLIMFYRTASSVHKGDF